MIKFPNGGRLVQEACDLPAVRGRTLYLDFETTSGDRRKKSLNPWRDCEIAGAGVTVDDEPGAWYVPVGHRDEHWNLPREVVLRWLQDSMDSCERWVNHNVKYDYHVAVNAGLRPPDDLLDTLTGAKIIDSDRVIRGGYSLTALSLGWLEEDVSSYEQRVKAFLTGARSLDYGEVPGDILGEYCCQDVITNRRLLACEERRCPEQCRGVWATENKLTSALVDMERTGLHVDVNEIRVTQLKTIQRMLEIEEQLHEFLGTAIRPHVNADCFDVLCSQFGLPVLGWTDEGNPSFDKNVLASYLRHPDVVANEKLAAAVNAMLKYRKLHTLDSLFLQVFLKLHEDGVLHPSYNQSVRTGRMSCSKPNSQQQSKESKSLVHPPPGYSFISADYSQIEFRIIVHYIRDVAVIDAYADDPDTDFHQWVADMTGTPRPVAKNINFMMAFGGGLRKTVAMLAANMELVGELMTEVNRIIASGDATEKERTVVFNELAERRAREVYSEYHDRLPGIKRKSRAASRRLKSRGYVYNAYGRHRRLPPNAAFRAFNSVIQSSAADVLKERTVATAPRYNRRLCDLDVHHAASVHDEFLFVAPTEVAHDPAFVAYLATELERTSVEFRVPMRVAIGVSDKSWAAAGDKAARVNVDRSLAIVP